MSPSVSPEVVPGNVEPSNDSVESLNSPQVQLHMKRSLELNFLSLSLNSLMGMFVIKWSTFWDAYEAFIHKNTTIDKFNYLSSILDKTASEKPSQVYPIHNFIKLCRGYRFFRRTHLEINKSNQQTYERSSSLCTRHF